MKLLIALAAVLTGGLLYFAYAYEQENLVFTALFVVGITLFIYCFERMEEIRRSELEEHHPTTKGKP